MKPCVFCLYGQRIITDQTPLHRVVEHTGFTVTVKPIDPVCEGHLLVIPRVHAQFVWDLPLKELLYIFEDLQRHAKTAGECNIIQSNGPSATQTIKHVHFHIVPRSFNDDLSLPWDRRLSQWQKESIERSLDEAADRSRKRFEE